MVDRFGNLIAQIDHNGIGCGDSFMGHRLPNADYWYKATSISQQEI